MPHYNTLAAPLYTCAHVPVEPNHPFVHHLTFRNASPSAFYYVFTAEWHCGNTGLVRYDSMASWLSAGDEIVAFKFEDVRFLRLTIELHRNGHVEVIKTQMDLRGNHLVRLVVYGFTEYPGSDSEGSATTYEGPFSDEEGSQSG